MNVLLCRLSFQYNYIWTRRSVTIFYFVHDKISLLSNKNK